MSNVPSKIKEEALSPEPEYALAEKAALRLVARAEQCTVGLARKLEKRKFNSVCVGKVISHLVEIGLVDDSRFARLWLQSRLRFSRSPRRLLASLCARGIDRDEAEAALKNVLNEEGAEAAMLARFAARFAKKFARKAGRRKPGSEDNEDSSARSLKFLLKSEGFSNEAIQKFPEKE